MNVLKQHPFHSPTMYLCIGLYLFTVVTLPLDLLKQSVSYTHRCAYRFICLFLGLDAIGEEIEDPFGKQPNDLPLNYISTNDRDESYATHRW